MRQINQSRFYWNLLHPPLLNQQMVKNPPLRVPGISVGWTRRNSRRFSEEEIWISMSLISTSHLSSYLSSWLAFVRADKCSPIWFLSQLKSPHESTSTGFKTNVHFESHYVSIPSCISNKSLIPLNLVACLFFWSKFLILNLRKLVVFRLQRISSLVTFIPSF